MQFALVHPSEARAIWPSMREWAATAFEDAGAPMTPDQVLERIEGAHVGFWLGLEEGATKAAFITVVADASGCPSSPKMLTVLTLGPERAPDWLEDWEQWASNLGRHLNCRYLHCTGPRGLVDTLKPFGWKEPSVNLVKDLCNG